MKVIAIIQVIAMLGLGLHDLVAGQESLQPDTEFSCCCGNPGDCCQDTSCDEEGEESSCSDDCSCGCSVLSAIQSCCTELPGNSLIAHYFPESASGYFFEFNKPLLHPPRLA